MKHIRTTIAALRAKCPFSTVNRRTIFDDVPQLQDVHEAVKLYQRPRDFFTSEVYMRTYHRADWRGAPPELRLFVWRFLRALRKRGLPFYVNNCWRSSEEQAQKVKDGYSSLMSGAHQRACAVDIVSAIDHWDVPQELWHYVGTLGEQVARDTFLPGGLKIEWGGRWRKPDPAHWQLSDWKVRPVVDLDEPRRLNPYSDEMRFG